jgi:putative Ca2+/H+ antiporter (TMEM165/GDT1 family)
VLSAALVSLGVVFVAELGDKSQLMTMTYALRHRWWVVLSGVAIAAFLVHGLSVTIGHFVGLTLPQRPIAFAAAIAFLLFAAWTWHGSRKGDDDEEVAVAEPRYVIFAVISSFVLAELGDKTMLATVALASDHDWAGVWIGATVGMVLADGVAIAVGALLPQAAARAVPAQPGQRPVPTVRTVASVRQRVGLAVGGRGHRHAGRRERAGYRGRRPRETPTRPRRLPPDTRFVAGYCLTTIGYCQSNDRQRRAVFEGPVTDVRESRGYRLPVCGTFSFSGKLLMPSRRVRW